MFCTAMNGTSFSDHLTLIKCQGESSEVLWSLKNLYSVQLKLVLVHLVDNTTQAAVFLSQTFLKLLGKEFKLHYICIFYM